MRLLMIRKSFPDIKIIRPQIHLEWTSTRKKKWPNWCRYNNTHCFIHELSLHILWAKLLRPILQRHFQVTFCLKKISVCVVLVEWDSNSIEKARVLLRLIRLASWNICVSFFLFLLILGRDGGRQTVGCVWFCVV